MVEMRPPHAISPPICIYITGDLSSGVGRTKKAARRAALSFLGSTRSPSNSPALRVLLWTLLVSRLISCRRRVHGMLFVLDLSSAFFSLFLLLLRDRLDHRRQVRRLFDFKCIAPHRVADRLGASGEFLAYQNLFDQVHGFGDDRHL